MDLKEAAETLGCSVKTVRRHIKKGLLEARKLEGQTGQAWDIPLSSLEAFKDRKPEVTVLPAVESNKQPGKALATVDTQGHLALDIGHGLVGHYREIRMREPGTHLDELPDVCDVELAAIFLDVSVATVRELLKAGELRGRKLGRVKLGKKVLIDSDDLNKLVQEGKKKR